MPTEADSPLPHPEGATGLPSWLAVAALILAAALGVAVAWTGRLCLTARAEASLSRNQARLAELELRSLRNQVEAERILTRRQLADEQARIAELSRQVADLKAKPASPAPPPAGR